jgi:hypothetical protein
MPMKKKNGKDKFIQKVTLFSSYRFPWQNRKIWPSGQILFSQNIKMKNVQMRRYTWVEATILT